MKFVVWLFLSKAAELNLEAIKAPEVLNLEKLKSWVNGSVWCLLALNLLSLIFYLGALAYPSLKQALANTISLVERWRERSIPQPPPAPQTEAVRSAEVPIPAPPPAPETMAFASTPAEPSHVTAEQLSTPDNPPASGPDSAPTMAETEVAAILDLPATDEPAAPAPEVAAEPSTLAEPTPFVSEVTEILDIPQEPLPDVPNFDEKEGEMGAETTVVEESNPTPVETPNTPPLFALEDTLLGDLQLTEATETKEAAIFDPSIIDQALKEGPKA